jgi:nitrate/nitrite-specific signal transduction histidine kinase
MVLAWGYGTTRQRILQPIAALQAATRRISEGNLRDSIRSLGHDELGELSQAFDQMRSEVATAHDQLQDHVARRTREIASAFELSQEIVAQLDLEHLLRSVVERASWRTPTHLPCACSTMPKRR